MAGVFQIIENKSDSVKFRGIVSFNGKPAQYYEVDLDVVGRAIENLQKEKMVAAEARIIEIDQEIAVQEASITNIPNYVSAKLQEVADQDAALASPALEDELQSII